ncbi:MAG: hypothetical protein JRG91_16295 [Deltaproteobacteria bacterium]|nr:hypothetical protein [Deltaproteobacteria bacterium]
MLFGLCTACGLLGPGGAPDRLPSDTPGPFVEEGPLELCIEGRRLDAPAVAGPDGGASTGFCVTLGREPTSCTTDAPCAERERCVCGLCRVPVCRSGSDCLEGFDCMGHGHRCQQGCAADGDCPAGERCDPTTLGCTPPCDEDADCAFGEVCSASRRLCVTMVCTGSECSASRTCDVQREGSVLSQPALLAGSPDVMWATVEAMGVVRFERAPGGSWSSPDAAPVLAWPGRDPGLAAAPDGGVILVAGRDDGSGIAAYTSPDGLDWSPIAGSGVIMTPTREWESGWVGRPSVLLDGDGWLLAYEGGPGTGIGLVRLSRDGGVLPLSTGPVLQPSSAGTAPYWTDLSAVGSPQLFRQDCAPGWTGPTLLFEATGLERIDLEVEGGDPPVPNASVGYARLDADGSLVVDPRGPMFTTMAGLAVTRSEHGPAISCRAGSWTLYYGASDPVSGLAQGLFLALSY